MAVKTQDFSEKLLSSLKNKNTLKMGKKSAQIQEKMSKNSS